MVASASLSVAYEKEKESIENFTKNLNETTGNVKGTNTTTTSGGVNVAETMGSINKNFTNASTNTSTVGGTTSVTFNSGRDDWTQTVLTEEAVKHLTDQMLEGTQGLAAVSKGQNISGGYNSTANTFITNDLISRIAGEVAVKGAKHLSHVGASSSTTTTSDQQITHNIGATSGHTDVGATKQITTVGGTTSTTDVDQTTNSVGRGLQEFKQEKEREETAVKAEVKAGWILCTELYKQGRLPYKHYVYGLKAFESYDEQSKKGYYIWAVPALAHLRAHPYSTLSRVMCKLLNARAEYIAAESGYKKANKTVLGFLAKHMYWGCWILSRTMARSYQVPEVSHGN